MSAYLRFQALALPLSKDKQLELAHAVIYDTPHPHIILYISVDRVQYTPTWTFRLRSFVESQICEIWNLEDNVRKRPFNKMS